MVLGAINLSPPNYFSSLIHRTKSFPKRPSFCGNPPFFAVFFFLLCPEPPSPQLAAFFFRSFIALPQLCSPRRGKHRDAALDCFSGEQELRNFFPFKKYLSPIRLFSLDSPSLLTFPPSSLFSPSNLSLLGCFPGGRLTSFFRQ